VEEYSTEPLHQRADRLAVDDMRIDRDADILDRDIIENVDMAGARIDRDMAGMGAVAVGPRRGGEGAFHFKPGEIRKARALATGGHCATADFDFLIGKPKPLCR